MNKKINNVKILQTLDNGYSIREVREYKEDVKTGTRTQTGSTIALYQGKKMKLDGFKNKQAAIDFYKE